MQRFLTTAHVSVKPHTIQLTLPLPYTGSWMTGRVEKGRAFTQTHTMNWTWTKPKCPQPLLLVFCPWKCCPPSIALQQHFSANTSAHSVLSHLGPTQHSCFSVGKLARKQLWFGQMLSLILLFFHWLIPAVCWKRKERDNRRWPWQESARALLWQLPQNVCCLLWLAKLMPLGQHLISAWKKASPDARSC